MRLTALLVMLSCSIACASDATDTKIVERKRNALAEVLSQLDSPELKQDATVHYANLLDLDFLDKAEPAIGFFQDLDLAATQWVFIVALDNKNYQAKDFAARCLRDIVPVGDPLILEALIPKLEAACNLVTGGSGVRIPRARYMKALVATVEKITGISFTDIDFASVDAMFSSVDAMRPVVAHAKQWLREKHEEMDE